jgi:NADH-quinone oxidoreductase subunit K
MTETALLHNYLVVGALLFGVGMIGFLSRRNIIVMFLSAEMMLQGVSLSLVAWGRFYNDFGGQMLVIFMIAVGACEAAIALALVLSLFAQTGKMDAAAWHELREADQPPFEEQELPAESPEPPPQWPKLPPAGVAPRVPPDQTDYRRHV